MSPAATVNPRGKTYPSVKILEVVDQVASRHGYRVNSKPNVSLTSGSLKYLRFYHKTYADFAQYHSVYITVFSKTVVSNPEIMISGNDIAFKEISEISREIEKELKRKFSGSLFTVTTSSTP